MSRKALTTRKKRSKLPPREGSTISAMYTRSQATPMQISPSRSPIRSPAKSPVRSPTTTSPSASEIRNNPALLDLLPAELVHGLCEQMDTRSLSQFVSSSRRHKAVCQRVLDQRRAQFEQTDPPLTPTQFVDLYHRTLIEVLSAGFDIPALYFLDDQGDVVVARAVTARENGGKVTAQVALWEGVVTQTFTIVDGYVAIERGALRSLVWGSNVGVRVMNRWNRRLLG